MRHTKARLFALVLIAVFAGLTWLGWHQLSTQGSYSLRLAAFAPLGVVGGVFVLIFPGKIGKPETTFDKFLVLVVFAIGMLVGFCNWYLMDPGFFHR